MSLHWGRPSVPTTIAPLRSSCVRCRKQCRGSESMTAYRISLSTSAGCWHWTRHSANPLIVGGWEARDPMGLPGDDQWLMYYTATSDGGVGGHDAPSNHIVAASLSADLVR